MRSTARKVAGAWVTLLVLAAGAAGAADAREPTEEEFSNFPRLYHLDDYDGCLSRKDGLYCLGTFELSSEKPNPIFDIMKEHSKAWYAFNYTRLHRGYCVSSRCPSAERPARLRFERCVAQWSGRRALNASLRTLRYCRTHAHHRAREPPFTINTINVPQLIFLIVVGLILLLNIVGTFYDVTSGDAKKKNRLLMAWSIPENWRQLTTIHVGGNPHLSALDSVHGFRFFMMAVVIYVHTAFVYYMMYINNTHYVEEVVRSMFMAIVQNGTIVMHAMIFLTNFIFAYNLLLHSKKHPVGFAILPKCILHRIIRISPVHLLFVAYAATWWPLAGSGPLWSTMVGRESAICRRKFWAHALYINNIVEPESHCLVQTWYLAVDVQLCILASALTIYLVRNRQRALPILGALFVLSCLLNSVLAYVFEWKPMLYVLVPKYLSTFFEGEPSFHILYTSTWSCLPACFTGLFMAHLHFELEEKGFKPAEHKWIVFLCNMCIPMMFAWAFSGYWLRHYSSPVFLAAFIALERINICLTSVGVLYGMINRVGGLPRGFFSWRGWHAMSRMSLSTLMVHWCICMIVIAPNVQPLYATIFGSATTAMAIGFVTFLLSVPVAVLVEKPTQKFFTLLLS